MNLYFGYDTTNKTYYNLSKDFLNILWSRVPSSTALTKEYLNYFVKAITALTDANKNTNLNSVRDTIINEMITFFPSTNFNIFNEKLATSNYSVNVVFVNTLNNFSQTVTSDTSISTTTTNLINIENTRNFNYILLTLNTSTSMVYTELLPNFYQNHSVRQPYTNSNSSTATLNLKGPNMNFSTSENILNCFWILMNYSKNSLFQTVLSFGYSYTISVFNPELTLSFGFTYPYGQVVMTGAYNSGDSRTVRQKTLATFTNVYQWQFICFNQSLVTGNDLKIELWYDNTFSVVSTSSVILWIITKALNNTNYTFNFILKNFRSDYTRISNFNLISYSSQNTATNPLLNIFYHFRFSPDKIIQNMNSSFLFDSCKDYSNETLSATGFNPVPNLTFLTNTSESFIMTIFSKGYPKFIFNYGKNVNTYCLHIKFDGEFIIKKFALNLTISLIILTQSSMNPVTIYNSNLKNKVFKKITFDKLTFDTPNVTIRITIGSNVINLNYNISSEIQNTNKKNSVITPDKFFDTKNSMIMSFNDNGYDEDTPMVKKNLPKYFIRNYYNTINVNPHLNKITTNWDCPTYQGSSIASQEITNVKYLLPVYKYSTPAQYEIDFTSITFPGNLRYLNFILQGTNTESYTYKSPFFYPNYITFSQTNYLKDGSSITSNSYKVLNYEPLRFFLNKNLLAFSTTTNILFLAVKYGDLYLSSISNLKFNYVSFPDKKPMTEFNTEEVIINTYDNLITYKITITCSSCDSSKNYFIDTVFNKFQIYTNGVIEVYIVFEPIERNQFIYSDQSNYNHSIYISNMLYSMKFIKKETEDFINYTDSSVIDETHHSENLVTYQLNSSSSNLNYSVNFSKGATSILWSYPKVPSLPLFENLITPVEEIKCNQENAVIYLKTNLRFFDWTKLNSEIILSVFENDFTVFFNPTCQCSNGYRIGTIKEYSKSDTKVSFLEFKSNEISDFIIYMNYCGVVGSDFNYIKKLKFEKVKFNTHTGTMNSISNSDQYLYMLDKISEYTLIKVDYEITNEVLLANRIDIYSLCSYSLTKFDDISTDYSSNIIYYDCFSVIIQKLDSTTNGSPVVLTLNNEFYKTSFSQIINFNSGEAPSYDLIIAPNTGYFDKTKFTLTIKWIYISSLNIMIKCHYTVCVEMKDDLCNTLSENNLIINEEKSDRDTFENLNYDFKVDSKYLNQIMKTYQVTLSCKVTDLINATSSSKSISNISVESAPIVPDPIPEPSSSNIDPIPSTSNVDPVPVQPSPLEPTPSDPTPSSPTPSDPTPSDPTPPPTPSEPIPSSNVDPAYPSNPDPSPILPSPVVPSGDSPINNSTSSVEPVDPIITPITPLNPNSNNQSKKFDEIIKPPLLNDPFKIPENIKEDFMNSTYSQKQEILNNLAQEISITNKNSTTNSTITSDDITQTLKQIIILSDLLYHNDCSGSGYNSTFCLKNEINIQNKIADRLTDILNCSKIFESIFGSESPSEQLILSALSLYYSTSNYDIFTNQSLYQLADLQTCLISKGPQIISDIKSYNQTKDQVNNSLIEDTKKDFVSTITYVSSNMIDVSKFYNKILVNNNTLIKSNLSLVITQNNLLIKDIIEKNSILWMKYGNESNQGNEGNNTVLNNNTFYETKNFLYKKEKLISQKIKNEKSRILIGSEKDLTDPNSIEDQLTEIKNFNASIKIFLPVEHLLNYTYKNNTPNSFGVILYNQYPLLSSNQNFSENVVSLKMYTDNYENIPINNLSPSQPIKIMIKKPNLNKNFTHCVFYNPLNKTWDTNNITSLDLGDYMLCISNHLTDFTLANFDPIKILKGTIELFLDQRFMNDFTLFKNLTWENAIVVKIYGVIFITYLLGLIFTICFDCRSEESAFIVETEKKEDGCNCCSNEETMETINELKELIAKQIDERRKEMLRAFLMNVVKHPDDNQKILEIIKTFITNENSAVENSKNQKVEKKLKNLNTSLGGMRFMKSFEKHKKMHSVAKIKKNIFAVYFNNTNSKNQLGEESDKSNISDKQITPNDSNFSINETNMSNLSNNSINCEFNTETHSSKKNLLKNILSKKKRDKVKEIELSVMENNENSENLENNSSSNQSAESETKIDLNAIENITIIDDIIKINNQIEIDFSEFLNTFLVSIEDSIDLKNKIYNELNITTVSKINKNKNNLNTNINTNSTLQTISNINNSMGLNLVEESASNTQEQNRKLIAEIQVKNEWCVKGSSLFRFFFKTEYRLIVLFIPQETSTSKTNFFSLIVFRLFFGLSICALLSECNSKTDRDEGYYTNRDLSVAVATILISEFPFIVIEIFLSKAKVFIGWSEGQK
jgi:hypothetical protein